MVFYVCARAIGPRAAGSVPHATFVIFQASTGRAKTNGCRLLPGKQRGREGKHTGRSIKKWACLSLESTSGNPSSKNILLFPSLNSSVHPTSRARPPGSPGPALPSTVKEPCSAPGPFLPEALALSVRVFMAPFSRQLQSSREALGLSCEPPSDSRRGPRCGV